MSPSGRKPEPAPDAVATDGAGRYQGFSLRSVTWGYRDVFEKTIEELFDQGLLGPHRREVTAKFFDLLKRSNQSCFDHVLRQFLGALSPANRWIMDLPGVFADVVELGGELAESKLHYGIRFFSTLAEGGMGSTPQAVRDAVTHVRRLREIDDELAMALLAGYRRLCERLRPDEIERYVQAALEIFRRHRANACAFLRGELRTSETYILAITQECRLCDVREPLAALLKALTGEEFELADLSQLDSDDLIDRGSETLTVAGHVYLPARVRRFGRARANRDWYVLCAVASASLMLDDSFPRVHGHREYPTCADLVGDDPRRANLFQVLEFARVLRRARRRWPGVRRLLAWGLETDLDNPAAGTPERLLADALDEAVRSPALRGLREAADDCVNCFDAAERLGEPWADAVAEEYPGLAARSLRPGGFLSDFLFPVGFSSPPADHVVGDLKSAARSRRGDDRDDARSVADGEAADSGQTAEEESSAPAATRSAYVYDEWDHTQGDYRPAWCHVHENPVQPAARQRPRADWLADARKVRNVFERLKPDLARREKHLAHGDDINTDLLLTHLVDRRREPSPPVRFYEKPLIRHRDLAVLILLDVSGSTGEAAGEQAKVLDVEKHAAVILGEGLAALDDTFAVCGFSSNGREQCEVLVFKDFDNPWADAVGRILAARPRNSTRMGPAIRHAGYRLDAQPCRQRLILLVTDGKPMDQGYDPNTRYAQHDVRMACQENLRRDVHTFAISTEENSQAHMEIMFPGRRFVILPGIRHLPRVLPELYLRLTL